jgi:hypothetical protein
MGFGLLPPAGEPRRGPFFGQTRPDFAGVLMISVKGPPQLAALGEMLYAGIRTVIRWIPTSLLMFVAWSVLPLLQV